MIHNRYTDPIVWSMMCAARAKPRFHKIHLIYPGTHPEYGPVWTQKLRAHLQELRLTALQAREVSHVA